MVLNICTTIESYAWTRQCHFLTCGLRFTYSFLILMQKYVLMMKRAVIIFKNTCLILELQKSEHLQNEDFLSILNPSGITVTLSVAPPRGQKLYYNFWHEKKVTFFSHFLSMKDFSNIFIIQIVKPDIS